MRTVPATLLTALLLITQAAHAQALPEARREGGHSLEQALAQRRSVREFAAAPLELGIVAGDVAGLAPGVYRYEPDSHRLSRVADGDRRAQLAAAAFRQGWIARAPAIFVIAGIEQRTTAKYGARGVRYVQMEAGHAGENLLLQATALGLGATLVGAFDDERVRSITGLPATARPLSLIPVGRPR